MTRLSQILATLLIAASLPVQAGDKGIVDAGKTIATEEPKSAPITWEIESAFSSVWGAKFKGFSHTDGIEAIDFSISAIGSKQVRDNLLLRFGFEYQRFDFSRPSGTPLPYTLDSTAAIVGLDFRIGSDWLGRIDVKPGLYGSNSNINARDFNAPIELGVSYLVSADLQLVIGASVNVNREYPVIPIVGARWKFAQDWVINAILPTPRLEYSASPSLTLYAGADFQGETYRVADLPAHSRREKRLEGTVVDYSQIRVGAGSTWSINQHFTLEVEAGFVPVHEFDYHRADSRLHSREVPPYAGISLKAEF